MTQQSAGAKFRQAVADEHPLQLMGTITAYAARMAKSAGYQAIYISGGGLAANSLGVPDLGVSGLEDVLIDIRRITDSCDLPLLVDADTGFGGAFNIARTVRLMTRAGAAGFHIEDQVAAKRCGHRPNKEIVTKDEMVDRVKAAVDARIDENFVIMARTDSIAIEGVDYAIERAQYYIEAGADMIFPEAISKLQDYKKFKAAVNVPVLANITEFGQTPLFSCEELAANGVDIVLYCCGAYRAMNKAAWKFYQSVRQQGHQRDMIESMQTREELYQFLDYHGYEKKLDELFSQEKSND